MDTKDRVRVNIYKNLLKEETQKRKRTSRVSATVCFALIGVVGITSYDYYSVKSTMQLASNNSVYTINAGQKKAKAEADKYFSEVVSSSNQLEVSTDEMFGLK
ncbi:MAG: hypothetical protein ACRCSK_00815 [Fusobacteriaceae bacterium]